MKAIRLSLALLGGVDRQAIGGARAMALGAIYAGATAKGGSPVHRAARRHGEAVVGRLGT